MKFTRNNYAFIDSQNLNLAIRGQGWILDFKKFRIYLLDKHGVSKAFIFLGYIEENKKLYDFLERVGYTCIFKPILEYKTGEVKGNCDAELVLQTMIEYENYEKAVIVTGDGDFYCLAKFLFEKKKLEALVIPNQYKFSALLKFNFFRPLLRYLNDLEKRLAYKKEKAP
ncbi:MAG: NYN domain-containing protein [Patescibacteria group bacterium]|nr:NYN domain-containing protein [Patescibacteria group bacterium]